MRQSVHTTRIHGRGPAGAAALAAVLLLLAGPRAFAQEQPRAPATISGHVTDAVKSTPIDGAVVTVEGTRVRTLTDSAGYYRLADVPAGPQTLRVNRVGYAPIHQSVVVPETGALVVDLEMAASALQVKGLTVTAEPVGRARGELGTATVIEEEAIKNQTATSLAGILELLPGQVLQAPGLDAVQQISLGAVPVSLGGSLPGSPNVAQPTAQNLSSFGTQIVVNGVPLSNNANLQSLGPSGELTFPNSVGGGIDLRRIPASTIERVEVIRGIPSAHFGDVTNGVIIVDTHAGVVDPLLSGLYDAHTLASSLVGGTAFGVKQTATAMVDVTRTMLSPGVSDARGYRLSGELAHRLTLGGAAAEPDQAAEPRLVMDTRLDFYKLYDDEPPTVEAPNVASSSRDAGLQFSERARLRLGHDSRLDLTASFEAVQQRSWSTQPLLRGEMPFTSNLDTGLAVGHFIGGAYQARVDVDGGPRDVYGRLEWTAFRQALGASHVLRAGTELRREWNAGAGYQFDIEYPPQTTFNGVQGFDRPRRFDVIPPEVTSAFYVDDRASYRIGAAGRFDVQAGLRLDLLHRGGSWFSSVRDNALQPRLNLEYAPQPWLRLRAGAGRLAKTPALADLYPSPQYYDVVNVNWYANDPAERLAILTTSILDPTNPSLSFSKAERAEVGLEADVPGAGMQLALVGYVDKLRGGVGIEPQTTYLVRAHYQLSDSTQGTGVPPTILQPPTYYDTVPALIYHRANNLTLHERGLELTALVREIPGIHTGIQLQGAWYWNRVDKVGVEFGTSFSDFQVSQTKPRVPYWTGTSRLGEQMLLTTRLIHRQPALGLVVTFTVQNTLRSITRDIGGSDSLSWAGYITRAGVLVPVPASERGQTQYNDLHIGRTGLYSQTKSPSDWLLSLQVSKTLPLEGRLSFYAFNALDKIGKYGGASSTPILYSATRFGVELWMPLASLWGGGSHGGAP
jgi:outer membrane receptor protein involved in Fe transport